MADRRRAASREVAPYGLMFGRTNYLVAAELGSTEPKSWRLDRIRDLTLLDRPAPAPEDFSLSAFAGRSFGVFHGDIEDVVLRIKPHGAADALGWRFHSNQQVAEQPDGSVLVSFRASGMLELAWHLFSWADKVEIIAAGRPAGPHGVRTPERARSSPSTPSRPQLDVAGSM